MIPVPEASDLSPLWTTAWHSADVALRRYGSIIRERDTGAQPRWKFLRFSTWRASRGAGSSLVGLTRLYVQEMMALIPALLWGGAGMTLCVGFK